MRFSPVNHKNKQTIYGKDKPHGSLKASCTSVLNHWKSLETTFTTESNDLPAKLALQFNPASYLINNLMFCTK